MKNYSKNLTVMLKAAEKSHMIFQRDYRELEMIQSSPNGTDKFALKSLEKIKNLVSEYISKVFGKEKVLSIEEFDHSPKNDCFYFGVDGFANFSRSLPYFSLTMGYINHLDLLESALIFCPALAEYYVIEEKQGAWKESIHGSGNKAVRLKMPKKITSSDLIFSAGNFYKSEIFSGKKNLNILNCESLSLAYLAGGKIDVHYLSGSNFFKKLADLFALEAFGLIEKKQDSWVISNHKYF